MADVDELFDIRNSLYIGNWQHCVSEAQKSQAEDKEECDTLMYRAMVAQGKYAVVKGDVTSSSASPLQAVKLLARYLHSKSDREAVMTEAKKMQEDDILSNNVNVMVPLASLFIQNRQPDEALKCLHRFPEDLEPLALSVQILIQMNRSDLASAKLKAMCKIDEDATLTQLATAWTSLAAGGQKLQEAFYVYQELAEKFGPTAMLLNGKAAALIQQGNYIDAEEALMSALDKDSDNAETLVNLISVSTYTEKAPEIAQRYLNQLRDSHPDHPFVSAISEKETLFDNLCAQQS